ncbi:MAG: hypothetical protein ACREMX_16285 [Gemmatimonadales bacterium]
MYPVHPDSRVYYDDAAVFTDSIRYTIRDAETWRSIWSRATQRQASAPPLPTIDFEHHMLLLVGAGPMRPGDEIHVDSVGKRRGRVVAVVRTTVECQPFPAKSYPFEIVVVRRSEAEVDFIERRDKAADCA